MDGGLMIAIALLAYLAACFGMGLWLKWRGRHQQ